MWPRRTWPADGGAFGAAAALIRRKCGPLWLGRRARGDGIVFGIGVGRRTARLARSRFSR